MAFDEEELDQLNSTFTDMFTHQRRVIVGDVETLLAPFQKKLASISKHLEKMQRDIDLIHGDINSIRIDLSVLRDNLAHVKHKIDELYVMESEDVQAAYSETKELKKTVKGLELRIAALER